MKVYQKYADQLDVLLDKIEWGNRIRSHRTEVESSLNGQAANVLRELAKPLAIWKTGAYFTGQELAGKAIGPLATRANLLDEPVYDPTCGAGDLLLRWSDALSATVDLIATLGRWETLLRGRDLEPEFIAVAKRRLILKAIAKGARLRGGKPPNADHLFPNLQEGDARTASEKPPRFTLVMNPPFGMVQAADKCSWASGKVSLAAVLFEACLKQAAPSSRIVAILPDVLRTGSRYGHWRELVEQKLQVVRVEPYGRFDEFADVDVFILEGVVSAGRKGSVSWWPSAGSPTKMAVEKLFDVSVGAVVPHRDLHTGPWVPFIAVGDLPPWESVHHAQPRRRFSGTRVMPPFVAVRRTSSPSDGQRAIGTIVTGNEFVAVENHLLVLKPHDGTVKCCEFVLQNLKNQRTRDWLDKRIRCRHLTVSVLRELPIWEEIM
ncbi:MAG: hypothetical protein HZA90_09975 [Verrucomicrobia bacterium]|nr:hypothetical protein [Verrucomicrobiota bacterium]